MKETKTDLWFNLALVIILFFIIFRKPEKDESVR